jgi:hypothetical protein
MAAKVAKIAKVVEPIATWSEKERAAPVARDAAVPRIWAEGLALLDSSRPPISFPAPWWRGLIRDAELFLATWGSQAADLGWTTLDLFGAHRKAPAANFSCLGLLLVLRGGRVVALTTSTAVIEQQSGARLTYTRRPPEAECVPVWELPHASQEHPTAAAARSP